MKLKCKQKYFVELFGFEKSQMANLELLVRETLDTATTSKKRQLETKYSSQKGILLQKLFATKDILQISRNAANKFLPQIFGLRSPVGSKLCISS